MRRGRGLIVVGLSSLCAKSVTYAPFHLICHKGRYSKSYPCGFWVRQSLPVGPFLSENWESDCTLRVLLEFNTIQGKQVLSAILHTGIDKSFIPFVSTSLAI